MVPSCLTLKLNLGTGVFTSTVGGVSVGSSKGKISAIFNHTTFNKRMFIKYQR